MKTTRILIVEDDEFSRGAIEKLLRSSGYGIRSCANGGDAVMCLNKECFDILITDLHMPGMDGFELIQKAKLIQPGIKTILITGLVNDETEEKAIGEKIDGFFHKPIAWGRLFAFLNTLSGSKSHRTPLFLESPHKSKRKPILRAIALVFVFFVLIFFNLQYPGAEEISYAQYRPSFKSEVKRDCSRSLSTFLTEEQFNALKDIQNAFYAETAPIRRDLMISSIEIRQLISDPRIEAKILLDRQKRILQLQSKLENLSLSYQMKARSIFTNEQLDRLPWDCMLGMGTEFGINVGIGRGPRRGPRW
ncbi:MAG: response regulator [Syntrophaceae bacterium]|nr:response regulator [Syntrophaceae bacterium]